MNELIDRINSFVQKSRIYLKQGEQPPKGVQVMRGKRGGMYYEAGKGAKSSSKPPIDDRTKRAIDKLTNDPEMEKRAKNAAQETIAIIADGLAVAVNREPTYHEIAEAVLDYGEIYGGDKEAIRWLRSLGPDEVARKIQRWDSPPKYAEELKPPIPLTADKTKEQYLSNRKIAVNKVKQMAKEGNLGAEFKKLRKYYAISPDEAGIPKDLRPRGDKKKQQYVHYD